MKKIIFGLSVLALSSCQSTDSQTSALENAAQEEQVADVQSDLATSPDVRQPEIADASTAQNTEPTQAGGPVVVGDTITAYRPPPIGTKMRWRLAGRRGVESHDSVVVAHNDTYKGQKVWTTKDDEFISYRTYSYNRIGRTFLDGSPKEDSTLNRELYRFPMKPGDKWTTSYRRIDKKPDRNRVLSGQVTVVGWENIATPAGKFKTMKMSIKFTAGTRKWTRTSWYSPEHGTDVKGRDTWKGGQFGWTLTKLQLP